MVPFLVRCGFLGSNSLPIDPIFIFHIIDIFIALLLAIAFFAIDLQCCSIGRGHL